MKLPNFKRSFEFYKRLVANNDCSSGKVAQISGVETQTVDAWTRPVESDEYPAGTGKRNTTDQVLRQIGLAYKHDPGLAHEWAEIFADYVRFLDEQQGVNYHAAEGSIDELAAVSNKEHADILVELLKSKKRDYGKIWTEYKQAGSVFQKLGAVIKAEMKSEFNID